MRGPFHSLLCTKVTTYERSIPTGETRVIWRYAFKRLRDDKRFVYSGKCIGCREGEVISLRASVKVERDAYGFTRLSRPQRIDIEGELL